MKMVSLNALSKLFVVVAFGLSATVTATDVAKEEARELLDTGFSRKYDKRSTELPEVEEPPMYSVEWYLLPKPENRAHLLEKLPFDIAKDVPEDCDELIDAALEKRIRKFFSLRGLIFRNFNSYHPEVQEPTKTNTQNKTDIANLFKYPVEWYLLPKPENRKRLRDKLPWHLYNAVPRDCNEPIDPLVEKEIREFFSVCSVDWYLLPEPINRAALRYAIPSYLAEKVPLDCNEPISQATERRIRGFFSYSEEQQRLLRLF